MNQDQHELAYWTVVAIAQTLARQYIDWGVLRPSDLVDAVNRGIEQAHREHLEAEDQARAGH